MSKVLRVELSGYDRNGDRIGTIYCRDKIGHLDGEPWISPKRGKEMLRARGAVKFKRENIWPNGMHPKLEEVVFHPKEEDIV